jgi:hypothetical protein
VSTRLCQPYEVILESIKLYKVRWKHWGLSGSPAIVIDSPAWCGAATTLCAGEVETPSLVEKLLSRGGIKVTKGAWQVPKWLAFVASPVVLLGETR